MPPPGLQIQPRPLVTIISDILTPKVDSFMPLPSAPLVIICTKIGSFVFVFKILSSQDEQTNEKKRQLSEQTAGKKTSCRPTDELELTEHTTAENVDNTITR